MNNIATANNKEQKLPVIKNILFPIITIGLIVTTYLISPFDQLYQFYFLDFMSLLINNLGLAVGFFLCVPIMTSLFAIVRGNAWMVENSENIKKISFISALSNKKWYELFITFPFTILMEEIIFRGIIFYFLASWLDGPMVILINGLLFGFYHLHIKFTTRDSKLAGIFIVASLFLGIWLAALMPYIGIWGCWICHLVCVLVIYLIWYYSYNQKE